MVGRDISNIALIVQTNIVTVFNYKQTNMRSCPATTANLLSFTGNVVANAATTIACNPS